MDRFICGINPLASSTPVKSCVTDGGIKEYSSSSGQNRVLKHVIRGTTALKLHAENVRGSENSKRADVKLMCMLCSKMILEDKFDVHLQQYHNIWLPKIREKIIKIQKQTEC